MIMMTKQDAKRVIDAACKSSEKIRVSWNKSVDLLREGAGTNGHGIYRDCSTLRSQLLQAKSHIDDALQSMDSAVWPTDEHYDLF
jgi:hypothetical protein